MQTVAFLIFFFIASSLSLAPTATSSSTLSQTQTLTVIPTSTSTVVPTVTFTSTDTATAPFPYHPIGIPDQFDASYEDHAHYSARWNSVQQNNLVAGSEAILSFSGLWMFSAASQIFVKFSFWTANCLGIAEGTSPAAVDNYKMVRMIAPSVPGQYILCLKHRQNWEPILNSVVNVTLSNPSSIFFGYSSCQALVSAKKTLIPNICGCFLQTLSGGNSVNIQMDFPFFTLLGNKNVPIVVKQGCCVRSTQKTNFSETTGETKFWGFCTDVYA